MHEQQFSSASGANRVVFTHEPASNLSEPKVLHPMNAGSKPEIDAEAYERGTRETLVFDHGFLKLPPD